MGTFIYLIITILFIVLILWTWNNVNYFENTYLKIGYIILGIVVNVIVSLIIYSIFKIDTGKINNTISEDLIKELSRSIRKIVLIIYTPINGLITMPIIARIIEKIKNGKKSKKIVIIFTILVIGIIIIEGIYLKDIQQNMINMLV